MAHLISPAGLNEASARGPGAHDVSANDINAKNDGTNDTGANEAGANYSSQSKGCIEHTGKHSFIVFCF